MKQNLSLDKPVVRVKLGASLNPIKIRESNDVYLECLVRAYPSVSTIVWLRDGQLLQSRPRSGLLLANRSLVLQQVRRDQAGAYSCRAQNTLGATTSNPFQLQINCKNVFANDNSFDRKTAIYIKTKFVCQAFGFLKRSARTDCG